MTGTVDSIWRYPVKSVGREEVTSAALTPGACLPFDRAYGIAHEQSTVDGSTWARCQNFLRVAGIPALAAVTCKTDPASGEIAFTHPQLGTLTTHPGQDPHALVAWIKPLVAETRAQPTRVIPAKAQGFTDSPEPTLTLCNLASHRAVSQKAGRELSIHRWRGNVWLDGLAPWEEFDWLDRDIQIGSATLRGIGRTDRCQATHANPDTGRRDIALLDVLETWGHQDFSLRAVVIEPGTIAPGDKVTLL
ncbi:MOSC domain-containing protein [Pseudaestuariivita sp.]|uniref:MOSC domain-containing protein n=1 Tax=Pseudaestuariivita sp. TaxID=2211669 RepID=UPI0040581E0D